VNGNLKPQIERALGMTDTSGQGLRIYGGAIALVLVILSAGVGLLLRDIAREARTNRLRSDFVSSVSHELKTPITLIRLYSETLLRPDAFREEDRDGFYSIIVRESERLGRLVDRILTFSRVERGDQVYNLEEGDVAPVIARVVEDYREYLERAGFRLERALAPSAPPVRFDSGALSQAVVNLLDNAVKYSGDSREIAVRLSAENGCVAFEVEDHGLGIPAAERERIFGRFYRVPNGSGKGGYGLGLFLVRHIMDAHGGRVDVDSEPGRGSRFRLMFPKVTG
jgi:two-component system phosphate regulon sensor histidine kinase PhoR